ncbi:MAG TPA: thiamine diphosphokinase [Chloroflexota bacterium]|jgi:thiamine pyrophosphokinase|nr:thiamine diphosphokinase [Chloroflexota bacterium]
MMGPGVDAVIVAHGELGPGAWARPRLHAAALVIAADGGAAAAWALGRAPDVVVGDLDSLDPRTRAALAGAGSAFEIAPREKDETDLELALRAAVRRGATTIEILGALGGPRFDHALANVLALALPFLGPRRVAILDPQHEVRLLRGPAALTLSGAPGDLVSLIPLSETADGIDTAGLRYPLRDGTLLLGPTRGVSNELSGPQATVRLRSGLLLVVQRPAEQARGSSGATP